ncbi:aminoglycoside adenylyltransferase family protein [Rugosimonospora acidiphila]|uniref:Aminoglycoside adenylyltransferase family protein n=1 Tax=Rugosimonospora acidiphila TaxID=556531 RepID=A0ABP9RRK3_9ACTN
MEQVQSVVRLVGDVLDGELVGSYLHGSSVLGGVRPASDLDVLVVSRRRMDDRERRALTQGLFAVSGEPAGARPVELVVVAQSEVRPWRFPPVADYQYGEWLREELAIDGAPAPRPMPDLALLIAVTLAADHPLSGPPPAQVLDPVPRLDVAAATVAGIPNLLDNLDNDTRNVVLTLARVWLTLATGEIRSKDAAADWALDHLPPEHRPVLEHAKQLYLNRRYSEDNWGDELTAKLRAYVDWVLAAIGRLSNR